MSEPGPRADDCCVATMPADRDPNVPKPDEVQIGSQISLSKNGLSRVHTYELQLRPEKFDTALVFVRREIQEQFGCAQRRT